MKYNVRVERTDSLHVNASVRDFEIQLGAKRADPTASFNPVETLLSPMGACLLTAISFVAEASHIPLAGARINLEVTRQDCPLGSVFRRSQFAVRITQYRQHVIMSVNKGHTTFAMPPNSK
ncbi:OsmC family protein [Acidithiobacillus ferrooxidans]|uniref:OsmC family protein n=1 Tax=Acidithiobacillus ferrooxidans TaxID=920 RepID=UPI00214B6006|nr:OsmC family protein [Acidithiobacillus ferrooxidans]MCR2832068.1 OsmC family protein [Acidithiobacillus ferrooxidans]